MTKNNEQILQGRYTAGRIAAGALKIAQDNIKIGMTTKELNQICHDFVYSQPGATAECIGYKPSGHASAYQYATCISINDVVCHGMPNDKEIIQDGDIVNVDIVVRYTDEHGYYLADTSVTICVGNVTEDQRKLVEVAKNAMYVGMSTAKTGMKVCDVGNSINKYIEELNDQSKDKNKDRDKGSYTIVPSLFSHCIGKKMHEQPSIPSFSNFREDVIPNMQCFTVEPIIKLGQSTMVYTDTDDWTMRTRDGKSATMFENTMCIDLNGQLRIFTTLNDEAEQDILNKIQEIQKCQTDRQSFNFLL